MKRAMRGGVAAALQVEGLALVFIAVPNAVFLAGWIVEPFGSLGALALLASVLWTVVRTDPGERNSLGRLWPLVLVTAVAWCLLGGLGHFFYANSDWWVRDAVLLDLVRDPWPVRYRIDGVDTLLRAPLGFYLPAALFGKVFGVRAAELFLMVWTMAGVSMVLALLLRDRPGVRAACIRIGVFVLFSGMDIVPTLVRLYPHHLGAMIEWWGKYIQYPSSSTLLLWVPNHTLPGWIATAWLLSQDLRRIAIQRAVLFVALAPLWSPLTALGIAPLALAVIVHRLRTGWNRASWASVFDPRVVLTAVVCAALIYPYLVAGSDVVPAGTMASIPWVGEQAAARYIEFVLVEFLGIASLLLIREPRHLLLWVGTAVLLVLPIFYFGPYNDLAMRSSIPALALLAILVGRWLSDPDAKRDLPMTRTIAIVLLAVGAVTPIMELSRPFITARWPMNVTASLIDVTRGTHYLTPADQPWLDEFLRPSAVSR